MGSRTFPVSRKCVGCKTVWELGTKRNDVLVLFLNTILIANSSPCMIVREEDIYRLAIINVVQRHNIDKRFKTNTHV